jgi:DtxR family Mn-dependent transcriptional regulator
MVDPLVALTIGTLILAGAGLLFWPQRGLFYRWQRARRASARVMAEDVLKYLLHCEMRGQQPSVEGVAGTLQLSRDDAAALLAHMESLDLLTAAQGGIQLSPGGRDSALHIIRAHRLWERYLADFTGYSEAEWHEQAERFEHTLLPAEADALSAQLGNPTHDPHGDPIPDTAGRYVGHGGQPLTSLALDRPARIVHIEDEPEAIYAQLVAEGLYPGQVVRLIEVGPQRVRFWANGDEHLLAPLLAANISVVSAPSEARPGAAELRPTGVTLASLLPGEQGQVLGLSPRCRGVERRRMLDLGFLPGTVITAELVSPGGDPTAYNVRGALIALRQEQAQLIHIVPVVGRIEAANTAEEGPAGHEG